MIEFNNLLTCQANQKFLNELSGNILTGSVSALGNSSGTAAFCKVLEDCLSGSRVNGLDSSASVGKSQTVGGMQASDSLVQFIADREGYSATPYRGADSQNLTIGYGHVIEPGENISYLDQQDALKLLKQDLAGCVQSVNQEFSGMKLTQNQFDSLVSFSYNLGENIWSKAPTLTSDIKSGASAQELQEDFSNFDHCNGQVLQGLVNRRQDEWEMFEYGKYDFGI